MIENRVSDSGLNALLMSEENILLLIDHQAFQFANLQRHDLRSRLAMKPRLRERGRYLLFR
jgi:hypothetical protein